MGIKIICQNKRARFDYFIEDTIECGIELKGTEAKSIKEAKCNLKDSFALIRHNEVVLKNMYISPYDFGNINNVNEMYQAMDVFILPSLFEGLPVVGIEAQAAGLKCIMSDTITDEVKITDILVNTVLSKRGWFTPPFETKNSLKNKLEKNYIIDDFEVEGAMVYFSLRKK